MSGLLILAGAHATYAFLATLATGSPPTGSPSSPGRRPTCSSAFAMDARSPGAPRRARAANRQRAAKRSDPRAVRELRVPPL
jgi:hypothetical protein